MYWAQKALAAAIAPEGEVCCAFVEVIADLNPGAVLRILECLEWWDDTEVFVEKCEVRQDESQRLILPFCGSCPRIGNFSKGTLLGGNLCIFARATAREDSKMNPVED